mgnify:CR=1 FL=1
MIHLVPLPLTHQVATTHGNHLLHDIISSIARGFGWHLGSEAARMVPDWLVILIVAAVGIYAIAQFVKKPRSQK